jgi:DtxR family Mn-dependent transcriptional regulator
VPWAEVHEEACRLEHAISPRLERYLVERLGDPGTCPHGNPIPGSAHPADDEPLTTLAEVRAGGAAVIRRIDEELEAHPDDMHTLESNRLLPGQALTVRTVEPNGVVVAVDGVEVALTDAIATKVYVAA